MNGALTMIHVGGDAIIISIDERTGQITMLTIPIPFPYS